MNLLFLLLLLISSAHSRSIGSQGPLAVSAGSIINSSVETAKIHSEALNDTTKVGGFKSVYINRGNGSGVLHASSGTFYLDGDASAIVVAGAANTAKLTLTSAGNVGIGTASPLTTLDVNGGATVRGQATVSGSSLTVTGSNGVWVHGGGLLVDGPIVANSKHQGWEFQGGNGQVTIMNAYDRIGGIYLQAKIDTLLTKLNTDSGGPVVIGAGGLTVSASTLTVTGSLDTQQIGMEAGGERFSFGVESSGTNYGLGFYAGSTLLGAWDKTTKNFGIATGNPLTVLDVNGAATLRGATTVSASSLTVTGAASLVGNVTVGDTGTTGVIALKTTASGATRLTITADDNTNTIASANTNVEVAAGGANSVLFKTNSANRATVDANGFRATPPAAQTIAAGNTVAADACGGIKKISSAGAVTTDTTNTFTAPAAGNDGCCMDVINTGANAITLDNNALFFSAGAADVVLGANDTVRVCSTGASGAWYQVGATGNN